MQYPHDVTQRCLLVYLPIAEACGLEVFKRVRCCFEMKAVGCQCNNKHECLLKGQSRILGMMNACLNNFC
jgi:hypothetical protein